MTLLNVYFARRYHERNRARGGPAGAELALAPVHCKLPAHSRSDASKAADMC